jgi:hypothetical protein
MKSVQKHLKVSALIEAYPEFSFFLLLQTKKDVIFSCMCCIIHYIVMSDIIWISFWTISTKPFCMYGTFPVNFINVVWLLFCYTPWPESASELYRPSDRRLSVKLVSTFSRGCHVVSVSDPYDRILAFLDRSRYFLFQLAPQLYSRGWLDPVLVAPGIEPGRLDL